MDYVTRMVSFRCDPLPLLRGVATKFFFSEGPDLELAMTRGGEH